jgi:type IV pilus assembly protein PilB
MAIGRKKEEFASAGKKKTLKDRTGASKLRLGEMLSKAGYITTRQFEDAKSKVNKSGERMSSVLRQLDYIEEDTVYNFLSRSHGYTAVNIASEPPSGDAIKAMPYETAKKYLAFPLRMAGNTLQIAMAEPTDSLAVEELQEELTKELDVCVAIDRDIIEAYKKYYKIDDEEANSFFSQKEDESEETLTITEVDDFGAIVSEAADDFEIESGGDDEGLDQFAASDAPIIKLVNGILVKAVQEGVSDIHIEPYEKTMQVRYRKDGSLFKSMNLPLTIKNALVARVKILSGLDITERRVPQDGRIKMRLGKQRSVDFRVSSLPTLFGESVVLRILDKGSLNVDLTMLGFEVSTFEMLKRCLSLPQGLLLVTGPTGSGKTVTLYSALNSLNSEDIKILTAEDPVEFNFKGINQVNVHQEVGMTFAAALKAFLRQDPDIIMVGEIRDIETAEIAIKAAMTGHLVFSTLHTNDTAATIGRLVDIGVPSYMIASSVSMVLAQRLGRRLCKECKKEKVYEPEELINAGFKEEEIDSLTLYGPVGCKTCNGLGYKGRVGFFELMEVTSEVAQAINSQVPEDQLRKIAIKEGMVPLRHAALEKVRQGVTSVEEAIRRTTIHQDRMPAYLLNPDVEEYEDGDSIIREGNVDNDFFRLVRGACSIVKGGKKIGEISEPGEYFGELSALLEVPRDVSVVAHGRCTVKRFPGDKLGEILDKYPEIASQLYKLSATRLQKSNKIIVKLAGGGIKRPAPATAQRTAH